MQRAVSILEQIAQQRGPGDANPLLSLRALEAHHGVPISHLPISQQIIQAWIRLTGSAFSQHHSLSLASWRRGEPFALMGGGIAVRQTLSLLIQEVLSDGGNARALIILPDPLAVECYHHDFMQMNQMLGNPLRFVSLLPRKRLSREAFRAHLIFTTPDVLHEHLLCYHDRAWRWLWEQLRILLIPEVEYYAGVAAAHLSGLLRRSLRLTPALPLLAATLSTVAGAEETLSELSGLSWRVIPINDVPRRASHVAVWQAGWRCLPDTLHLAFHYQMQGYSVHITCGPLEHVSLSTAIAVNRRDAGKQDPNSQISIGSIPRTAQIQLVVGLPGSLMTVRQILHGAFDQTPLLTIWVLGNSPLERTLTQRVREDATRDKPISLLFDLPPPAWLPPPVNAYTAALHLLCGAHERPLTAQEVMDWQAEDLVARLEGRKYLVHLPASPPVWKPSLAQQPHRNPYGEFGLHTAGSPMVRLYNERGSPIGVLDAALFDRWGFSSAALPFACPSYRVVARNDDAATLSLRAEDECRRTLPLRRCAVTIREEHSSKCIRNCRIGWGRVLIDEEIYAYREGKEGQKPVDQALVPSLSTRWSAPAIWVQVSRALPAAGQLVGWSLPFALPLLVVCQVTDLVPAYDEQQQQLYLIDAQPGGNGISLWVYDHLEEVLPLAYEVALSCLGDALFEQLARIDLDWMLELLAGVGKSGTGVSSPTPPSLYRETEAAPPPSDHEASSWVVSEAWTTAPDASPTTPASRSATANAAIDPSASVSRKASRQSRAPRGKRMAPNTAEKSHASETAVPPGQPHMAHPLSQGSGSGGLSNTADPSDTYEPIVVTPDETFSQSKATLVRPQQPLRQHLGPSFKPGDRVFCRSYGEGVVRTSQIQRGQEQLTIEFPSFGTLAIDPSVSDVRRIDASE